MRNDTRILALLLVGSAVLASRADPALAVEPTPTAKPMPAADIQKAYAGKTVTWDDGQMYWSPDGKVMGYSHQHKAIADGAWDVTDGRICYHATWLGANPGDQPYPLNNCFSYMVDGKRVFYRFTSDKMKSNDTWSEGGSDLNHLKSGNTIRSQYAALKAKMPNR
jgi:hypothetical protein